jgi:hypothetical protein
MAHVVSAPPRELLQSAVAPPLGSFRAECLRPPSMSNSGVVCDHGGGQAVERTERGGCGGDGDAAA